MDFRTAITQATGNLHKPLRTTNLQDMYALSKFHFKLGITIHKYPIQSF
jgi:hypothetical protein